MNKLRIIPSLLLDNKNLVKTINFKNPTYIGDPLNAIKIFNELFVDEVILLDISRSSNNIPIDIEYLKNLTSECFIPICYGGGVSSEKMASELYSIGIEKIAINSAANTNPELIRKLVTQFGSQSIVGVVDYKKKCLRGHRVVVNNKKHTFYTPLDYSLMLEELGVGELLINAIDRDGRMSGYDLELLSTLSQKISIPIIANCGAGHLNDMKEVFIETGINAFAAGSLFVYSGSLKGILINYPSRKEIQDIFNSH